MFSSHSMSNIMQLQHFWSLELMGTQIKSKAKSNDTYCQPADDKKSNNASCSLHSFERQINPPRPHNIHFDCVMYGNLTFWTVTPTEENKGVIVVLVKRIIKLTYFCPIYMIDTCYCIMFLYTREKQSTVGSAECVCVCVHLYVCAKKKQI